MLWPYGYERADVAIRRADPYIPFIGVGNVESTVPSTWDCTSMQEPA